ncbi:hypothetical protein [Saccharopolyspora sp. 5N708]|uniref:hypothetical protein n=1 Tax=Saccharopolyspora sp. 5N708 TaxID=3457424 RepID=UPI003FD42A96
MIFPGVRVDTGQSTVAARGYRTRPGIRLRTAPPTPWASLADSYQQSTGQETSGWSGAAALEYLKTGAELVGGIAGLGEATIALGEATSGAGEAVASTLQEVTRLVNEATGKIILILNQARGGASDLRRERRGRDPASRAGCRGIRRADHRAPAETAVQRAEPKSHRHDYAEWPLAVLV